MLEAVGSRGLKPHAPYALGLKVGGPHSQKWFASGEALSHLEHLVHIGLVDRIYKTGMPIYGLI